MIYIPFIYFSLLFAYIFREKKRFDVSACIVLAYIITSLFAIIIDYKKLYGEAGCVQASISITPTLLYCLLITITILPFKKLPTLNKNNVIPIKNEKLLSYVTSFYFIMFITFILFFGKEIVNRLQNPDIASLRLFIASGEDDLGFSNYTGIIRIIARLSFIVGSSAMFLHVIYFYNLAFSKKTFKFNLAILICSCMPIMIGMLSIDRSKSIYWLMSYIMVATFFWNVLDTKQKKHIISTALIFFIIFVFYLSFVTIARYGEQNVGSGNSLIVYAGQSFNNYCLFFDKLNYHGISLEHITPLLNSIIGSSDNISKAQLYDSVIDAHVFASFCGLMIREIGVVGSIVYCTIYCIIANLIFKKKMKYDITKIFLVVILLYIPYLGIFGLYYTSLDREITVWVILILCHFLKKSNINSKRLIS